MSPHPDPPRSRDPQTTSVQVVDTNTDTRWTFDRAFLESKWNCIWGRGCKGILDEDAEALNHGCCSVGAELLDTDEAMMVAALAATIDPARFQFAAVAAADGIFHPAADRSSSLHRTRVVDDACVFLNRPGFDGELGCALHLQAEADGESPLDWKPSVCWQLPLKVDRSIGTDGSTEARLRPWARPDWGPGGETMAWCCTEPGAAFQGDQPVIDNLADELEALVGHAVYVELKRKLAP